MINSSFPAIYADFLFLLLDLIGSLWYFLCSDWTIWKDVNEVNTVTTYLTYSTYVAHSHFLKLCQRLPSIQTAFFQTLSTIQQTPSFVTLHSRSLCSEVAVMWLAVTGIELELSCRLARTSVSVVQHHLGCQLRQGASQTQWHESSLEKDGNHIFVLERSEEKQTCETCF